MIQSVEEIKRSRKLTREFAVRADRSLSPHDVLKIEALPKLNDAYSSGSRHLCYEVRAEAQANPGEWRVYAMYAEEPSNE